MDASSLKDIFNKQIYINQTKYDVFEMVFKTDDNDNNIKKEFNKKTIYTSNPEEIIGHIAYTDLTITNRTITVTGETRSEQITKPFINYIYFEKYKIVVVIDELIGGKIEDNLPIDNCYIKFSEDIIKNNYINLSFIFPKMEAEIQFYNHFFENDDKKYYFTSGKCISDNKERYYINSFNDTIYKTKNNELVTGYLFYAFLQIFYPEQIYDKFTHTGETTKFHILEKAIEKAKELSKIVETVYNDSKYYPNIKKYYSIPDNFEIIENEINKTVNLEDYLNFIKIEDEKNPNVKLIPNNSLEILSKYFNLNCNVIEFNDNELINTLNDNDIHIKKFNKDIELLKKEDKPELFINKFTKQNKKQNKISELESQLSKKKKEQEDLENELERLESNKNYIPIKNIPLNHSEGCKLYPFTDENQLYPYTFCNLDGNKWYLKKHNCQIKYDEFKGGAKQRYEDLKNQELKNQEINRINDDNNNDDEDNVVCDIDDCDNDDDCDDDNNNNNNNDDDDDDDDDDDKDNDNNDNSSPPNTDQKKMNIQKRTTVDYFFAKNSSFIESKGKKYLFAIVYTDTDKKKDNIEDVDFNSIIDLKENLVFKKEQTEQKEQRYVNSFRADIRITNINNPVYEIDYNTQKYYVIPL